MEQTAFVALVAAFLGSIIGPWVQKLWVEPYALRKQKSRNCYEVFIQNVDGFYTRELPKDKISTLCEQYRMAWLYAEDSVIHSINHLLRSLNRPIESPSQGSSEWRLGAAILQMRKRNIRCTWLSPADYLLRTPAQLQE
jgi:hypothetical protein